MREERDERKEERKKREAQFVLRIPLIVFGWPKLESLKQFGPYLFSFLSSLVHSIRRARLQNLAAVCFLPAAAQRLAQADAHNQALAVDLGRELPCRDPGAFGIEHL